MNEHAANKRLTNNIFSRSARRARKPLQEDWIKVPGQGTWVECTYIKCSFQWQYFGRRKWAECPICHTVMRVAAAKRNFISQNKANPQDGRKVK
jgi:ssDNA-binding Zn-finger/Zn-ribbon topoisomerase 1